MKFLNAIKNGDQNTNKKYSYHFNTGLKYGPKLLCLKFLQPF